MSNITGVRSVHSLSPARMLAAHQGYTDVCQGLGIHPDYDRWDEIDQRNYENWRHRATAIITQGMNPPRWPTPTRRPEAVTRAAHRAQDATAAQGPDVVKTIHVPRAEPKAPPLIAPLPVRERTTTTINPEEIGL